MEARQSMRVRVTFFEELLGTASADPEIHRRFIAGKAPDAKSVEEEVEAIGVDAVVERDLTVFPRFTEADERRNPDHKKGKPFLYDYMWRGCFKDSCGMLRRGDGYKSKKLTAYKKVVDGLIFVSPRKIPLNLPEGGEIGYCQRPLRASTAQGERIALSNSETVPEGTTQEFTVNVLKADLMDYVREWLDYGAYHGTGQWRNSGKGRFYWEELDEDGNVIGGNADEWA